MEINEPKNFNQEKTLYKVAATRGLPQHLYVRREVDGSSEYYIAADEALDAIDGDDPTVVGTYKIVEINKLSKRVVSEKV
jgi:hypothetical protein